MFRQLLGTSMLVAAGAATLGDLPRPLGQTFLADSTQPSTAIAAGGGLTAASRGAEEAIRSKLARWERLFGDRRATRGAEPRLTFSGFEDLYIDPSEGGAEGSDSQGWTRYRQLRQMGVAESFVEWRVSDVRLSRLSVQGDWAVSALTFALRGPGAGAGFGGAEGDANAEAPPRAGGRATHVWRLQEGDWRIVQEHLSGPERIEGETVQAG